MQYVLKKEVFEDFVRAVMGSFDFIAPVRGDPSKRVQKSRFTTISSPKDIVALPASTYFSAKGFFFDKKETLFTFDGNNLENPVLDIPPRVLFGLRKCDLNGISHQDIVFLENSTPDPFYKARRDATLLIGLHCESGDEFCFCNSIGLKEFHDLMFFDLDDVYAVEVGSEKGKYFLKQFSSFFQEQDGVIKPSDRETINTLTLNTQDIKKFFHHSGWQELADTCISCGSCNLLCPNCHCATIKDEVGFDLKSGKRVRIPASCQLKSFTRVAGEHIFRNERVERYKHRIYHQLQYFKERHDTQFCTGCGRCIRGCPVKINWVNKINEMESGN